MSRRLRLASIYATTRLMPLTKAEKKKLRRKGKL